MGVTTSNCGVRVPANRNAAGGGDRWKSVRMNVSETSLGSDADEMERMLNPFLETKETT